MPPKYKRRSANKSHENVNDGSPQEDYQQNHNMDIDLGGSGDGYSPSANVNGNKSLEDISPVTPSPDTSSSEEPTVTTTNPISNQQSDDTENEEESEVVISGSLNFGQNSTIELKTKVLVEQEESSSPPRVTAADKSSDQEPGSVDNLSSSSSHSYTTASASSTASPKNSSTVSAPPDLNYQDDHQLPSTVTTLTVRNTKVLLIGTAHFSTQSQDDVRSVVRLSQPDCILLELCPSRRNILHLDEEMLLREAGDISLAKIAATLRNAPPNSSKVQSLLHLLLLSMSASLTKKLGMAPGGEFRAAVQEAEKLPKKVTILLGDRPFNVTMARAIASLSFVQKLKLAWQFLLSTDDITKEEIEKCKERDLLEKMLSEMTGEFPSITEVFVNERDYFLAHTLYMSAEAISEAKQHGEAVVVAVVGMGHVPGICKNFGTTNEVEFDRVGSLPPVTPNSTMKWALKTTVKLTFYGFIGYGAYKLFNRIDFFKKFENGFKIGVVKIK